MRRLVLITVLALASASTSLAAQESLVRSGCRLAQAPDLGLKAPAAFPKPLRYGDKAWQTIQFYPGKAETSAPLVIAFSRAADEWARYRFSEAGIALAVVPDMETVPAARKTIDNYLAALSYLYRDAEKLRIDRSRVVFYGGGLTALFGTGPTLLGRAGIPFEALRGVISIGGEDFDIVRRMKESAYLRSRYQRYLGHGESEAAAFSAASHLEAPNAPAFLLLADAHDSNGLRESRSFAEALANAGSPATFVALPEQREGVRRTYFLAEQGGSGWEIMAFLRAAFANAP
jgi:arylformamidase